MNAAPLFAMFPLRMTMNEVHAIPTPISANGKAESPEFRPSASLTWACMVTITNGLMVRPASMSSAKSFRIACSLNTCRMASMVSIQIERLATISTWGGTSSGTRASSPIRKSASRNPKAPPKPNNPPNSRAKTLPKIRDNVIAMALRAIALNSCAGETRAGTRA